MSVEGGAHLLIIWGRKKDGMTTYARLKAWSPFSGRERKFDGWKSPAGTMHSECEEGGKNEGTVER